MFYTLLVEQLAGSIWLAVLLIGMLFLVIGLFGKMSFFLLITLMAFFLIVYGVLLGGIIVWLPIFLLSITYMMIQIYKFTQE